MGKVLLKNLNATPIARLNTLDRPATHNSQRSIEHPPAKRLRRDSALASDSQRALYPPTSQRTGEAGPIPDGSLDDQYDIKSQSSAEQRSQASSTPPPRHRRRKPKKSGLLVSQEKHSRASSGSPDVFDVDELDRLPPTTISSDVPDSNANGSAGRPIGHVEVPFKRQRRGSVTAEKIQDSEDELAQTISPTTGNLKKRRLTDFDSLQTRETKRRSIIKGDITPTKFLPSIRSDHRSKPSSICHLEGIVTGDQFWESSSNQTAALVFDDIKTFRFSRNGVFNEASVFDIETNAVQLLSHAIDKSCYVSLRRRLTFGQMSQMWLHFVSQSDAVKFVGFIPSAPDRKLDPQKLERMFQNKKKEAREFQSKRRTQDSISRTNARSNVPPSSVLDISKDDTRTAGLTEEGPKKGEPDRPRREKLVDKLARSVTDSSTNCLDLSESPRYDQVAPRPLRSGTATYRTRRSSPKTDLSQEVKVDQWTHQNPGWQNRWHKSLVYPATGKNRTTVDAVDIVRLDEGEFLNDNLINFYLRYLQVQLEKEKPEVLKKVHVFSSFFYEKLKSATKYEGVRSWTARIDLFSYDYIIVPVNEHAHWYLAIICNVGQTLPELEPASRAAHESQERAAGHSRSLKASDKSTEMQTIPVEDGFGSPHTPGIQDEAVTYPSDLSSERIRPGAAVGGSWTKLDMMAPKIITLDSLDGSHSATCRSLKTYLECEAQDKKGVELTFLPGGMKGKDIPHQDNFCDCGVFVLGYMEEFLRDPDGSARRLLRKEKLNWTIKPQLLRNKIRSLLLDLQEEQQGRLTEEIAKKKALRFKRKAAASDTLDPSKDNSVSHSPNPPSDLARSRPLALKDDASKEDHLIRKEALAPLTDVEATRATDAPLSVEQDVQNLPRVLGSSPSHQSPAHRSDSPQSLPGSSPSGASNQAFYSAPSSPGDGMGLGDGLISSATDMVDDRPFSKMLPSSDSENEGLTLSKTKKKKKKRKKKKKSKLKKDSASEDHLHPSVENDDDESVAMAQLRSPELIASGSEQAVSATVSSYFTLAPATDERGSLPHSVQHESVQQSIE